MKAKTHINIGTRGSKLALFQANTVKDMLSHSFPEYSFEIKIISTKGDRIVDQPLSQIGDKGLFTRELEEQLLSGEIDMAVHSLKDLPTELPKGLTVGAILERADPRDVVVSSNHLTLNSLTRSHTVATSSLRRKAALLNLNPELHIVDIRGNIDTRIRKMQEGYCDAIVMAAAGVERLGLTHFITEYLDRETLIPAPGQGAIAVETASAHAAVAPFLAKLNHPNTALEVQAERSFLNRLQGGCQVPIGCFARIMGNSLQLTGFIATVTGELFIRESYTGTSAQAWETGIHLAEIILHKGGQQILENLRSNI